MTLPKRVGDAQRPLLTLEKAGPETRCPWYRWTKAACPVHRLPATRRVKRRTQCGGTVFRHRQTGRGLNAGAMPSSSAGGCDRTCRSLRACGQQNTEGSPEHCGRSAAEMFQRIAGTGPTSTNSEGRSSSGRCLAEQPPILDRVGGAGGDCAGVFEHHPVDRVEHQVVR